MRFFSMMMVLGAFAQFDVAFVRRAGELGEEILRQACLDPTPP